MGTQQQTEEEGNFTVANYALDNGAFKPQNSDNCPGDTLECPK
jgi:hypothetical protein